VFVCLAPPNAPAGKYDQVRINFANPDMVGHTGDLAATVACCTLVDACVAELLAVVDEMGGRFLLTSDHGNADDMAQVGGWVGGWVGEPCLGCEGSGSCVYPSCRAMPGPGLGHPPEPAS
jgi:hypothetical protein